MQGAQGRDGRCQGFNFTHTVDVQGRLVADHIVQNRQALGTQPCSHAGTDAGEVCSAWVCCRARICPRAVGFTQDAAVSLYHRLNLGGRVHGRTVDLSGQQGIVDSAQQHRVGLPIGCSQARHARQHIGLHNRACAATRLGIVADCPNGSALQNSLLCQRQQVLMAVETTAIGGCAVDQLQKRFQRDRVEHVQPGHGQGFQADARHRMDRGSCRACRYGIQGIDQVGHRLQFIERV